MNTPRTTRAVAGSISVLTLAALTACGTIGDYALNRDPFLHQSSKDVARTSFGAMRDVTSMRMLGEVDDAERGRMSVDLSLGQGGCSGRIDLVDIGGFQVRHNEDGTWIRVDEKFWQTQAGSRRQGEQAWKVVRDRWISVEDDEEIVELCDLDELLAKFEVRPDDTSEAFDADDVVEVGDSNTIPITGGKGKNRTTLWVSLDEPHHVLKMAPAKDKGLPDALFFEEFGVKVVVDSPAKKEIYVLPNGQPPL